MSKTEPSAYLVLGGPAHGRSLPSSGASVLHFPVPSALGELDEHKTLLRTFDYRLARISWRGLETSAYWIPSHISEGEQTAFIRHTLEDAVRHQAGLGDGGVVSVDVEVCRQAFETYYTSLHERVNDVIRKARAKGVQIPEPTGPRLQRDAEGNYNDATLKIKFSSWQAAWHACSRAHASRAENRQDQLAKEVLRGLEEQRPDRIAQAIDFLLSGAQFDKLSGQQKETMLAGLRDLRHLVEDVERMGWSLP